jgi:hypothetical protein
LFFLSLCQSIARLPLSYYSLNTLINALLYAVCWCDRNYIAAFTLL